MGNIVTYFAYGSNMSLSDFRLTCPSARTLGRAFLENRRIEVTVRQDNTVLSALTYEVVAGEPQPVLPSREYLSLLISGAEEAGLPEDYIARIRN